MPKCQLVMQKNVQGHRIASVCKQTYDASCKATCKCASLVMPPATMRGRSWGVRGLEAALPFALPVAELPRGTEIWRLQNIGSFRTSSAGMASTLSKRWGRKALQAVTYPVSLASNCRQMLTVLKRIVAPYAKAQAVLLELGCHGGPVVM